MKISSALKAVGLVGCAAALACSAASVPSGASVREDGDAAASVEAAAGSGADDDGASPTPTSQVDAGTSTDAGPLGGWTIGTTPPDGGLRDAASGDGGTPAPAILQIDHFAMAIGPITINAGEEKTVCITRRLSNSMSVFVPHIATTLSSGSHHLIVYRSDATTEAPTPTPCQSFGGIMGGAEAPLMISQRLADDLTFPSGVALKLAPTQMVTLEVHYINPSSQALSAQGSVVFDGISAATPDVVESDLAFWGTESIYLFPHTTGIAGPLFKAGINGTKGFAVTTHQHRLGTRFRIWFATSASDINHAPVADTTDWESPPLYKVDPEMAFDGTNGLAFECEWNNTTGAAVTFGESALQEMCFLWMYYYPSHGFDMRVQ